MITKLLSVLTLTVLVTSSAMAQMSDVDITASRKKLDEQRSHSNEVTTVTKEIVYRITLASHTFKPLSNIEVKYMVFYYDTKAGSKDKPVEAFHKGSQTVASLGPNQSVTVDTDSFSLSSNTLDAGWVWANGASARNQDRVTGIWVRAYIDGKMVAELSNPSTIAKRNNWKD